MYCPFIISHIRFYNFQSKLLPYSISGGQTFKNFLMVQVCNMKHRSNEQNRISQDSMFNLHEIAYDLPQFVWFIQTYPDLLCACGIEEILDQLDRILLIDPAIPQLLSYDTTFQLGDFYVSTLLFRHVIFKESPVIPALFLIHERKFQSVHETLVLNSC